MTVPSTIPDTVQVASDSATASSFSTSFQHSDVTEEVYKERVDKLRKILVEGTFSTAQYSTVHPNRTECNFLNEVDPNHHRI